MSIFSVVKKYSSLIAVLLLFPNFVFANMGHADFNISGSSIITILFISFLCLMICVGIIFLCIRYTLVQCFGVTKSIGSWWKIFGFEILLAVLLIFIHSWFYVYLIGFSGIENKAWYSPENYNQIFVLYGDIIMKLQFGLLPVFYGIGVYIVHKWIK